MIRNYLNLSVISSNDFPSTEPLLPTNIITIITPTRDNNPRKAYRAGTPPNDNSTGSMKPVDARDSLNAIMLIPDAIPLMFVGYSSAPQFIMIV